MCFLYVSFQITPVISFSRNKGTYRCKLLLNEFKQIHNIQLRQIRAHLLNYTTCNHSIIHSAAERWPKVVCNACKICLPAVNVNQKKKCDVRNPRKPFPSLVFVVDVDVVAVCKIRYGTNPCQIGLLLLLQLSSSHNNGVELGAIAAGRSSRKQDINLLARVVYAIAAETNDVQLSSTPFSSRRPATMAPIHPLMVRPYTVRRRRWVVVADSGSIANLFDTGEKKRAN